MGNFVINYRIHEEEILEDNILDFYSGLITISQNVFKLELRDGNIITGDLTENISKEYKTVYNNDFFGSIGETKIYNKSLNETYTIYRLIEMFI